MKQDTESGNNHTHPLRLFENQSAKGKGRGIVKKHIDNLLAKLPAILSSGPSIFIYLFLFFYLVLYALLCILIPPLAPFAPSNAVQLIMGNYTNVLSALGASLAAGTGVAVHSSLRGLHKKHDLLHATIEELHKKIEKLESKDSEQKNSDS